ncbi:MAG: hypothetical protein M3121_06475 [Chloroflexota bacterium]|nr:hypothetical protein [Chloroflexota bacterium]
MLTIPFAVFALFRYLVLAYRCSDGNSEWLLFHHVPIVGAIADWGGVSVPVLATA